MKKLLSLLLALVSLLFVQADVFASSKKSALPVVHIPKGFSVTERLEYVKLSWKKDVNATGYVVSRSTDRDTWHKIATIKSNSTVKYSDYSAEEDKLYYYSIKAYKKVNGKNYYSNVTKIVPIFFGFNFYLTSNNDSVDLDWQVVAGASGYEIYYSTNNYNFSKIKTITDNSQNHFNKNKITPYKNNYYFYIKVYKNSKGKKKYLFQTDTLSTNSLKSVINGSAGKAKKSFKTVNIQGKKAEVAYTVSLTNADKNCMNKFNAEHFTNDMSAYDKIRETFMFIHKNVTYASGNLYSKIDGCTYASAIFDKRIGQCAQYNGAMVEYLADMGINVKLLMGYRGKNNSNKWQHFWGQAKLKNGNTYVIETGNYGQDGDWYYFFTPYSQTKKYLKCGKYISGIKP